ncbi:MAG: hypothetical protein KGM18_03660 [Sphingomonadales bacterium]|nr:hypothetical protein [Sphingomonadales bacterium]
MVDVIEANWIVLAVALLAVIVVGWLLLRRGSGAPQRRERRPDVLDEGQAPAARNQALIDAPPAAQIITPLPGSVGMAGIGEVIAVAAQDEVDAADAREAETPEVPVAPQTQASVDSDDLSRIKGLGPKLQALLPTLGITTYAQIASLDDAGLAALDAKLGPFAGRPAKDNWVEQARYLATGDVSGFEGKFGKV